MGFSILSVSCYESSSSNRVIPVLLFIRLWLLEIIRFNNVRSYIVLEVIYSINNY